MRFGCCAAMVVGKGPDMGTGVNPDTGNRENSMQPVTGIELLERVEALGFDYIELSLADIMKCSESGFAELRSKIRDSRLDSEVCNNFFPSQIKITGPDADLQGNLDYAARAFDRLAQLGGQMVVLGSSGSKNVPEGFSRAKAWGQLVDLLGRMETLAAKQAVTVVLEPLNRREANFINTVAEALQLTREVNGSHIQVLSDYYHLVLEGEDPDILLQADSSLRHVHFAEPNGRCYPYQLKPDYRNYFTLLERIGYSARVSIEAYTSNFENETAVALSILRKLTPGG